MKSIKFKLVLLFLILTLLVMITTGVFIMFSIQAAEANRIQLELSEFAGLVDRNFVQVHRHHDQIHQAVIDEVVFARPDVSVAVLDARGVDYNGRPFSSSVVISAMIGEPAFHAWERSQGTTAGIEGIVTTWMSYATPVTVEETGETLIIYLRQNVRSLWESIENTIATIIVSIVIAMVLAAVLGSFFSNTLTHPILVLTKISKDMSKGNLSQRIPVFSDDEIGQLAISFNHMAQNLQRHEDMRREFVANVSHEIRTPLTVIKSYAETLLEDEDNPMKANFLATISTEVDRMTMLASDLLELSQFDNKQLKLNNKAWSLVEILAGAVEQTQILAAEKNQTIQFLRPTFTADFWCDQLRISQVFINIISNAIKYSPADTTITITTAQTEGIFTVVVADQGFGIPKHDINRIFERFYRVDKARSRNLGGTGLGLSIVKEILDLYQADIRITSKLNHGTQVMLTFPLALSPIEQEQDELL